MPKVEQKVEPEVEADTWAWLTAPQAAKVLDCHISVIVKHAWAQDWQHRWVGGPAGGCVQFLVPIR